MFIVHYHDEKDPEAIEVFVGPFTTEEEALRYCEGLPDPIWIGTRAVEVLPITEPHELTTFCQLAWAAHRRHMRMRQGARD